MAQPATGVLPLATHATAQPDINAHDAALERAVVSITKTHNEKELTELLEGVLNVNCPYHTYNNRATFLHAAAIVGHIQCIQHLLKHAINLNIQDPYGYTALHRAARNGHTECVQLLLERGANPNIQNQYGKTPLERAASWYHTNCVQLLLTHILACGDADSIERLRPLVAQLMAQPTDAGMAASLMMACYEAFSIGYSKDTPPVAEDDPQALAQRDSDIAQAFRQYTETYVLKPLQTSPHYAPLVQSLETCAKRHWPAHTQKQ
jgi:hypothetical protein